MSTSDLVDGECDFSLHEWPQKKSNRVSCVQIDSMLDEMANMFKPKITEIQIVTDRPKSEPLLDINMQILRNVIMRAFVNQSSEMQ